MKKAIYILTITLIASCSAPKNNEREVALDTPQGIPEVEIPIDPTAEIDSYIILSKSFQPKASYSDNSEMKSDVEELENFGYVSRKYRDSKDKKVIAKSKELAQKAKSLQIKFFPVIRKNYVAMHKHKMWENNIDIRQNGSTTLELSGGIFANNKNIQDTYEMTREALELMRFKRLNFRWYKGADEYTYYNINGPKDSE